MGIKEIKENVLEAQKDIKTLKKDLEMDSNSVYLITKEKNKYFVISVILLSVFITFVLFSIFYIYGKLSSIDSKIDSMINAEDEYYEYEENIDINSGDGGNANYIDGDNNSISN